MTLMRTVSMVLILSIMITTGPSLASAQTSLKTYPVPVAELDEALTAWLQHSGFQVRRGSQKMGEIELHAVKAAETWRILLSPRSSLATKVDASCTVEGEPGEACQKDLDNYIGRYLSGDKPEPPPPQQAKNPTAVIPTCVLAKLETVVCLKGRLRDRDIQFSGFFVDQDGLILSTAHDVKDLREITVVLSDGQHFPGTLVKIDPHRDLALIDIDVESDMFISLAGGRNLLGMGEWLYSVGCPINLRGTVSPGIVNGPPRRADRLPLWQVNMEIHPGSSGSPVFDVEGNFVAIVKGRYKGTDSVGFLIPFETIVSFAKE